MLIYETAGESEKTVLENHLETFNIDWDPTIWISSIEIEFVTGNSGIWSPSFLINW